MYTKLIMDVFTQKECKKLISYTEKTQRLEYITIHDSRTNKTYVDKTFNKRKGIVFKDDKLDYFKDKLLDLINGQKIQNNVIYDDIESFYFNKYVETDFLNYHKDLHPLQNGSLHTMVIQLNEEYDGGDFCYMIDGDEYVLPKKTGSVFIFDCNILHKVNVVTNGTRYSYNAWPKYKKIKSSLI